VEGYLKRRYFAKFGTTTLVLTIILDTWCSSEEFTK